MQKTKNINIITNKHRYDVSETGIWYDFSLNPNGAIFTIYKRKDNTLKDIEAFKKYLKANRDVVGKINIINVDNNGDLI